MNFSVRKARMSDIRSIHSLLLTSSADGLLLPRSLSELYGHLRDFYVVEDDSAIVGCGALSIRRLFALTYQVPFFHALGFVTVEKDVLPQKVWMDCIHCPKFPDCDETAVLIEP